MQVEGLSEEEVSVFHEHRGGSSIPPVTLAPVNMVDLPTKVSNNEVSLFETEGLSY